MSAQINKEKPEAGWEAGGDVGLGFHKRVFESVGMGEIGQSCLGHIVEMLRRVLVTGKVPSQTHGNTV